MVRAYLVAGLGLGDCSKGATTEFLVRKNKAGLVIRYNGGCQAMHNVVLGDGTQHTFAQFGCGMFQPNVLTHLSRFVIINPIGMMIEEKCLRAKGVSNAWARTTVSEGALVASPFQRALNRLTEILRGESKHGSCGQGIGQTRSDHLEFGDGVLFAKDLRNPRLTREKLEFLRVTCLGRVNRSGEKLPRKFEREHDLLKSDTAVDWYTKEYGDWPAKVVGEDQFYSLLRLTEVSVFEGAQGVLLDEKHGTAPHNSWTNTTFENALAILGEASIPEYKKVGCIRIYATRHGEGPFPTQDDRLVPFLPEPHNSKRNFQGKFRVGHFDVPNTRKAISVCGGVDCISLSHLDLWNPYLRIRVANDPQVYYKPRDAGAYVHLIESGLNVPTTIAAFGPRFEDREVVKRGGCHNGRLILDCSESTLLGNGVPSSGD